MSPMRANRITIVMLLTLPLALAACEEEQTEACKQLGAEAAAQVSIADESAKTMGSQIKQALADPPATADSPCPVPDLNPRNHWLVTAQTIDSATEADQIAGLRSRTARAGDCKFMPPDEQGAQLDELRKVAKEFPSRHELVFVEESRVKPKLLGDGKYAPGTLDGQLFLWSYGTQSVVCASRAKGMSGEKLTTIHSKPGDSDQALNNQLEFLAVKNGFESLRRVEP